ncbi:MAG: hypothetical protein HY775_03545 [Acidobacteria bacterium]|nr:hypothetical protein [Acidobacteriota bacterium]
MGAWLLASRPLHYAALDPDTRTVLDNVYDGTACAVEDAGGVPVGPTGASPEDAGVPVEGESSTVPFGACTTYLPCTTAYARLITEYHPGWWGLQGEVALEYEAYYGEAVAWAAIATRFDDNAGNVWSLTPETSLAPVQYVDHVGYRTRARGEATYTWLDPDPAVTAARLRDHQTHVGYKAQYEKLGRPPEPKCWASDFRTAVAEPVRLGGWCDQP